MCFIRENIIQINSNVPNQSIGKQQYGYLLVQKGSPIRYSSEELQDVKPKVDHDSKYKILSSNVCKIVRSLRINKRQTRRGRKPQNHILNENVRTVNCKNLVLIRTTKTQAEYDRHKDFTLALGNVQSIKNKDDIIAEFLHDTKPGVLVATKTWLSPEDNIWKSGSEIVKEGYGFNKIHQCKRRGGGLALLHKTNLKVKRLSQCMSPYIELAVWKVTSLQMSLHIVGVYHPPDKSTIPCGNCLDLVFTEELSRMKVKKCLISDYLLDHAVVLYELTIPKQDQIRK